MPAFAILLGIVIDVRVLNPDELHLWIKLRIDAVAEAPGACGDTVEQAKRESEEEWRESLVDSGSCLLIAVDSELPVRNGSGPQVSGKTDFLRCSGKSRGKATLPAIGV